MKTALSFKALTIGILALIFFSLVSSFVEFWMIGLFPVTTFTFESQQNNLSPTVQMFISQPGVSLIILLAVNIIRFLPTGVILSIVAKKHLVLHGAIIVGVATMFLFFSLFQSGLLNSLGDLLLFLLNGFLGFSLFILGTIIGEKSKKGTTVKRERQ